MEDQSHTGILDNGFVGAIAVAVAKGEVEDPFSVWHS